MADNFQISTEKINNEGFIIVSGDFDGSSAFELINVINSNFKYCKKIIINTSKLNKIFPFGRKIFKSKKYLLKNKSKELIFIGDQAKKLQFK